jgi:hypothetical protein
MAISYELAKQLKDQGFDQRDYLLELEAGNKGYSIDGGYHLVMDEPELVEQLGSENCKKRKAYCYKIEYLQSEEGKNNTVYIPTLSELIEACGDGFSSLENGGDDWGAYSTLITFWNDPVGYGKTPEEAVARLYIALNQKTNV